MMNDAAGGVRLWNWRFPIAGILSVPDFHGPVLPHCIWIVYKQQVVPMCPVYPTLVRLAAKVGFPALITDLRAEAPRSRRTSAHYERLIALLDREAPYRRQRR